MTRGRWGGSSRAFIRGQATAARVSILEAQGRPSFAGHPLTGEWPEHCPDCKEPLQWAEVPKDTEPYLVCVNEGCSLRCHADGATWTEYHNAFSEEAGQ